MDIDLLSKMIKELIPEQDEVLLPGLGSFVAEMVPASFSDKGYTINPPYKRLSFRQKKDSPDTSLIQLYATSNGVDEVTAERILADFLSELKQVLQQKKLVIFPRLGRLRATKENNFFFIADEDLDIYPAGFGLEPISLKSHEETTEEVSTAVAELASIIEENSTDETTDETESTEELPIVIEDKMDENNSTDDQPIAAGDKSDGLHEEIILPDTEPAEELGGNRSLGEAEEGVKTQNQREKPKKVGKTLLWLILIVVILAVLLLVAFLIVARLSPQSLDHILYTKEQLEILNYNL